MVFIRIAPNRRCIGAPRLQIVREIRLRSILDYPFTRPTAFTRSSLPEIALIVERIGRFGREWIFESATRSMNLIPANRMNPISFLGSRSLSSGLEWI